MAHFNHCINNSIILHTHLSLLIHVEKWVEGPPTTKYIMTLLSYIEHWQRSTHQLTVAITIAASSVTYSTWWRHQMVTFSALLAICAGNSPAPGEFPAQRPVTRSFDVFFDLHPNKRLSKQWWGWWFETPPCPLRRHRNDNTSRWCRHTCDTFWSISIENMYWVWTEYPMRYIAYKRHFDVGTRQLISATSD